MLVEKDVTSIDVRGMKLVMTQIQALGQMGEQSETYNIPILVEDKLGNLSLKIVRGSEEKGLVDVALDMDESGAVSASFRYENGQISGDVAFEKEDIAGLFSDHMPYLANAMREETGLPVSFAYAADAGTNVDDFYEKEDAFCCDKRAGRGFDQGLIRDRAEFCSRGGRTFVLRMDLQKSARIG